MILRIIVVSAARQRKAADVLSFGARRSEIIAEIKFMFFVRVVVDCQVEAFRTARRGESLLEFDWLKICV